MRWTSRAPFVGSESMNSGGKPRFMFKAHHLLPEDTGQLNLSLSFCTCKMGILYWGHNVRLNALTHEV